MGWPPSRLIGVPIASLVVLTTPGIGVASDRVVQRWGVEEGLPVNAVTDVIQTRDGYLWIASWAGIVRFDGVRFTRIAEDLPNVHARALLEDRDGVVWIGTSGAGVVRWVPGAVEYFDERRGLADNDVLALAQDAEGRVWVGTERGVSVIDGGRVRAWRTADGLPADLVPSIAARRDGRRLDRDAKRHLQRRP